jgi:bifunctional UDP-N-acetylglucosamine pyrophosphorylase / glucosamine-1-phosphate N-acetyltransferase
MRSGVSILDPATTWIDVTVKLAPDAEIDQNSQLLGETSVAGGAIVGPDSTLIDTTVGEGAVVLRTHSIGAEIGADATVGPFSFLRPGTKLGRKAKVGGFVETKNAELGDGAKVPHLSYVGDATIGAKANIGAGTIFANYDGVNKNHITVGEAAFVGSDTVLIAPVEIEPGAYVAAGSAIAQRVPAGSLGVTRAQQRNVENWVLRRRAGTVSAAAAERALAEQDADGEISTAE